MDLFNKLFSAFSKCKTSEQNTSNLIKYNIINEETSEALDISISIGTKSQEPEIVPIEVLLNKATKSKRGLYPHEILMLDYAHTYNTSNNYFQGFWLYQYSVKEPQKILQSLETRGFIVAGDLKSALTHITVADLKKELQSIGQKVTGKKDVLIDRLLCSADHSILESKYKERYFILSESGKAELKENDYVSYLHKNRFLSIWDMNYLLWHDNYLHLGYRDIIWEELNKQSIENFKDGNMGLYRNNRLSMYQFLLEEDKKKAAFPLLCEVVMYDLSGLGNNEEFSEDKEWKNFKLELSLDMNFPYEKSCVALPPSIVQSLKDMQEFLKASDDIFAGELLKQFVGIHLYRRIFSDEECVQIVINELNNNKEALSIIYKKAENRLKQQLRGLEI